MRALHPAPARPRGAARRAPRRLAATPSDDAPPPPSRAAGGRDDVSPGLKAAWYGAEALGDVVGAIKGNNTTATTMTRADAASSTLPRADALAAIRRDYDAVYFVSGAGDMEAYDEECVFADPFASFAGVARFKKNVANLGGLLTDVRLDVTGWDERDDVLVTRWTFSGILTAFPWRPRLAAAGATTHTFDARTGRVVRHYEDWATAPGEVVRNLLKPSARVPSSRWEVWADAMYRGAYDAAYRAAAPAVTAGALVNAVWARAASGGGAAGVGELVLWCGVVAGVAASVLDKLPRAK